jgi:predicted ATPase/serine/threonine protein kinase/GAF domain-containing protein
MQLPGYTDMDVLHDGVRTTVLRARRITDGQLVVLKQLRTPFPSAAELARLHREFDLGAAAAGPSIVAMHGMHSGEGTAWLEMEHCRGSSLEALAARRPLPSRVVVEIALRLVAALDHVHRAGIVHKDVSPANIILDPDSREVRLIDFGIATTTGLQAPLRVDRLEGTPSYMSPEQTGRMNRVIDWRSDYYSLGATLYHLLTGAPPFPGTDTLEAVHAHIARRAAAPHDVNASIPETISNIVMTLLAKRPDDRYQSAAGLRHDLERCLNELKESGSIRPFPLRTEDLGDTLRIPDTLYGRAEEAAALDGAIQRVANGGSEAFFVTGAAGTGKTSLVGEIHRGGVVHRALFVSGKFEQFQREVPYSAVLRGLRGLIDQLLGLDPAQVDGWRARLAEALGENGAVLTEVIPELEHLVGKQPRPPEVSPQEAENRFRNTLVRVVAALPAGGRPVVLFFDDLQWADPSSIGLLEQLLVDPSLNRVLVLGTWRSNEVDEAHLLSRALSRAKTLGGRMTRVELGPLALHDVRQLLAETLGRPEDEVAALAELAHTWTEGNPFPLHRVIHRLREEELFRREGGRWTWDLAEVTRRAAGLNAAGFVARRLAELPEESTRVLEVASCVGTDFSIRTLATVLECTPTEVLGRLAPALTRKLVHPLSQDWWPGATDDLDYQFAFSHDRIQEAAHSRLDPVGQRAIHLRVGRLLREQRDADLFKVVHHLNIARELLSPEERAALGELDAEAGRKAMRSGAYGPALQLLEQAVALLPPDSWERDPATTRALVLDAARAASLAGAHDRVDAHLEAALMHATTPLHRATALQVRAYDRAGSRPIEAIDVAVQALGELGVVVPRHPAMADVQGAVGAAMGALAGRGHEGVLALPELEDPATATAIQLANSIMAPSYISEPLLLPILAAELVKQTATNGVTPQGTYGYAVMALVLNASGAFEPAYQLGQLTLRLMERFHDRGHDARPGHVLYGMVLPYTLPLREAVAGHKTFLSRALAAGDHEYAMWIAHLSLVNAFYAGAPLDALAVDYERESLAMRRLGQPAILDCTDSTRRLVRALRGQTPRPDRFDEEGYSEEAEFARLVASGNRGGAYVLQTQRIFLRAMNRDFRGILELADAAEQYIDGVASTYHPIIFQQAVALACIGLAASESVPEARAALLERAQKNRAGLAGPAAHAPHNHLHRLHLIDAELARLQGDNFTAIERYDDAIKAARENGYVAAEAFANELAGRFYRARGRMTPARAYLLEACSAWARWGATAHLKQLEEELPDLVGRQAPTTTASSLETTGVDLDLSTLSKATLAITSEIRSERLVERVLTVSVQNAGATRGVLLLDRDGALRLEAAHGEGFSAPGTPLAQLTGVPVSILQYVARTSARLVLPDARSDARFSSDPAIAAARPLSVLAFPLVLRGHASGVIYLENDLTSDAFPPERIQLQEMLGAQAAISLENARLYNEMEAQVARRTQELSVANQLLESSNAELEERVQVKVAEALASAEQMESLTRRLQERVRDRSVELSRALDRLASGPHRQNGLVSGTVLGDSVRIVRQIGAGGMGAVYQGEDLRTGERVAVKVVLASRLRDELAMQRFLRESRAAASVSHPAVARTLGVDVSEDGLIFQVQEFVDGESLTQALVGGRWMREGEAARLGATLASALAEAHGVGVVHRDLKPSNVMLTAGEPGLKLLDFGIARLAGDDSEPQLTATGQLIGTPDFMAPEQFLNPDHVDGRIDVYALGIVLYWSIAGRLPHRSVHLAARHVLDPIAIDEVVPDLMTEVVELIMACLARDPSARPTSAALAGALAEIANRSGAEPLTALAAKRIAVARVPRADNTVTLEGPRSNSTPGDETSAITPTPPRYGERG